MRKRDVSSVVEAIADYNANNPTKSIKNGDAYKQGEDGLTKDGSLGKYLDTLSTNTETVTVKVPTSTEMDEANVANSSIIYVYKGYKCDGNTALKEAGARSSAVVGTTENANSYEHYCSDAS